MGNESYVYKEDDLSQKELYLKKQLVTFFKELSYVGGAILWDGSSRKRSKWLIKNLVVDGC